MGGLGDVGAEKCDLDREEHGPNRDQLPLGPVPQPTRNRQEQHRVQHEGRSDRDPVDVGQTVRGAKPRTSATTPAASTQLIVGT